MIRDVTVGAERVAVPWVAPAEGRRAGLSKILVKGGPRLLFGGVVIFVFLAVALLAPLISPYEPTAQNLREALRGPSEAHWLGTDELGRDVLSRAIHGSRVSVLVGVVAVGIAIIIGGAMGLASGYLGGWADVAIQRLVEVKLAFPSMILALALASMIGPGLLGIFIAIGVVGIPIFARVTRAEVLSARERDYVLAARALGTPAWRILLKNILPNVMAPIIVLATLRLGTAILAESALSFLGMGLQPPTPTWGSMVSAGKGYLEVAPWLAVPTGLMILFTVLAFNILGDAIRDILDPHIYEGAAGKMIGATAKM